MEWNKSTQQWIQALSSDNPTPGGGAAAAVCGAMGCALVMMAIRTTLKHKNIPQSTRDLLERDLPGWEQDLDSLNSLSLRDAVVYENYLQACRLPKTDRTRETLMQEALWVAACVPADTATLCQKILTQTTHVEPCIVKGIVSDVYCAKHLLHAAISCCVENIKINLAYMTQQERAEKLKQILQTLQTVH